MTQLLSEDKKKTFTPNKPAPVLVIFAIVPLIAILGALLMIALQPPKSAPTADTINSLNYSANNYLDKEAPYFELATLDGRVVTLDDYAGKTLFLNFWQTTCPPCVRELPALSEFAHAKSSQDVEVLAVNFDETSERITNFLAEIDVVGLPVALDPVSNVRRTYGVADIPVTFVIDGDGIVRYWKLGEMDYFEMEEYAALMATSAAANEG
ncbi:MAG: TlpA family protein disulfide reductase [Anaerolineaceae bacterium]|nr:TlpA family protein disulfide reductase [Anaerolineaceae bacterium]